VLHSEATQRFVPNLDAARTARQFVVATLAGWGCEIDEAVMVMSSELIVNAVKHAKSNYEVRIARDGGCVRVEVRDWSIVRPVLRDPSLDATSGRGLQFVSELASRWGVDSAEQGKAVWFEIDRDE
jgi:anti-sigma regulatory factor (Ser/Thr protein kinase)